MGLYVLWGRGDFLDELTMFYRQHRNNEVGYTTDKNIFNRFREKVVYITQRKEKQVDKQTEEIYKYRFYMTKANLCTVEKVMNYRKNFKTRIRLASDLIRLGFSKKGTKYEILTAFVVSLGNV